MSDCVDCGGTGQVGLARDGQPLVCTRCGGTGGAPKPATPMVDDPRPFLPDEQCLECDHSRAQHEAHPDGWCNVEGCSCDKYQDPGGQEMPPMERYREERQVHFLDQDDLGRGIWGQGLK